MNEGASGGRSTSALSLALALALAIGVADVSLAKDNTGNTVKVDKKPGQGPKAVPPGQIKRYTRGTKLPTDLRFTDIGDLSKWKLRPPGKGTRYIRVDDEILEVTDDLSTVVDAVGIVSDLLK